MSIHGGIDQYDRDSTMDDFKAGNIKLLVSYLHLLIIVIIVIIINTCANEVNYVLPDICLSLCLLMEGQLCLLPLWGW